tara:strand:- start:5523 stop:5834 length:312 start_codon:yes stop_codon:yes gene_type:complete
LLEYADTVYSGMEQSAHGGTEREHEDSLRAMGADIPEKKSVMPMAVVYLWDIHQDISLSSNDGVTMDTVINYTKHIGLNLGRIELKAIITLDLIFRRYIHGNG